MFFACLRFKNQGGFFMFKKSLLPLVLLVLLSAAAVFANSPADVQNEVKNYILENNETLSFWNLSAVYSAGVDITADEGLQIDVAEPNENSQPTDYAKYILTKLMQGENPSVYASLLAQKQAGTGSFSSLSNQHTWAMITLDAAGARYNRPKALAHLKSFQKSDGGFALGGEDEPSYIDATGMALVALSQYNDRDTQQVISAAAGFIKNKWLSSDILNNANSLSTVISGLCAVGEDIFTSGWLKDEKSLFGALCEFKLEDGSFFYMADDEEADTLATAQALIAMSDIINQRSVWASFATLSSVTVNLRIEGAATTYYDGDITILGTPPTALDAILDALEGNNIEYEIIEYDSPPGIPFLSSIADDTGGKFDGTGYWMYIVNGAWTDNGLSEQYLADNDEVLVYYGDMAPGTVIATYAITPSTLRAKESFTITLSADYFDWESGNTITVNIKDATVRVGEKTYLTNAAGEAVIDGIKSAGTYKVNISKMNAAGYPAIVRIPEFEITVEKATSDDSAQTPSTRFPAIQVPTEKNVETTADLKSKPAEVVAKLFQDEQLISDWAKDAIVKMAALKIMTGNENNDFLPQAEITRAEFTALLVRLLNLELLENSIDFADIGNGEWYCSYIITAKANNLITGYDDNTFRPQNTVSREEMAVILSRAYSFEQDGIAFGDDADISDWAKEAVLKVGASGIMHGSGGNFEPQKSVTREMAAVVAARLTEKF